MPKVQFYKKYGAITSKIAKAGLMPSALHGVRCMGMPPSRLKAFRTTVGRFLPGKHAGRSLTWRLAMHECDPTHTCRVEPIVAWAEAIWDRQLDDVDLFAQGLEATATTGRPEAIVEQSRWPDGGHHHVLDAVGMVMASPHDLRLCKWARDRLATELPQGRQSKRWLTANWHCGKTGLVTVMSGKSSSHARFRLVDARGGAQGRNI